MLLLSPLRIKRKEPSQNSAGNQAMTFLKGRFVKLFNLSYYPLISRIIILTFLVIHR